VIVLQTDAWASLIVFKSLSRNQIPLDDTEEEEILKFLPSCVSWIAKELSKGKGVLVHCQVGCDIMNHILISIICRRQGIVSDLPSRPGRR
jgi:hypothetical protein